MLKVESKGAPQGFLSLIQDEIPKVQPKIVEPVGKKAANSSITQSKSGNDIRTEAKVLSRNSSGSKTNQPINRSHSTSSPPTYEDGQSETSEGSSFDDVIESACDNVLDKNFNAISQLTATATEEQLSSLAYLFVSLCEAAGIECELQEWCIRVIVSSASKPELVGALSLPQEIVKQSLNQSIPKWKKESLDCILNSLNQLEGPVDVNNKEGALRLIRVVEDFQDDLSMRYYDISLNFREGRVLLNQLVQEKFNVKPLPFAIKSFTNLIVNSLLHQCSIEKLNEEQMSQIRMVLETVKDVAERKKNYKFNFLEDFVDASKEKQIEWLRLLSDEEDVRMCRNIVDSSTRKRKPNQFNLLIAKQTFLRKYHQLLANADSSDAESDVGDEELEEEQPFYQESNQDKIAEELVKKMDKTEWKKAKTLANGFSVYSAKSNGGEILMKVNGKVKCDLMSTVEFFTVAEAHPMYDSWSIHRTQRTRISEDKVHMVGLCHPPWPITKRQFGVEETTTLDLKEGRVLVVRSQLDCELSKGYIRVITKPSGIRFLTDKQNPEYTIFEALVHIDVGGSVPVWAIGNTKNGSMISKYAQIAEDCESSNRNKKLMVMKSQCQHSNLNKSRGSTIF